MNFQEQQEAKRRDFRANTGEGQDAVTERLRMYKRNGKMFYQKGMAALMSTVKAHNKMYHFLRYDDAANYFFKSGHCYRACGKWREAADSLTRCAQMYVTLKMQLEAAAVYVQASEIYMMLDKTEGYKSYIKAIGLYCNIGRFDIAGRLEMKLALQDFMFRHFEDSIGHYRRASNFLAGESVLDQSDYCIERLAECYLEINQYENARKEFELVAEGCVNSNMRRFNAKEALKMASFCILARELVIVFDEDDKLVKKKKKKEETLVEKKPQQDVPNAGGSEGAASSSSSSTAAVAAPGSPGTVGADGQSKIKLPDALPAKALTTDEMVVVQSKEKKYNKAMEDIEAYERIDYTWSTSKEIQFIRNIVKFRVAFDLDNFVDHMYYYNNVCPLSRYQLKLLKVVIDEMSVELARRATNIKRAELKQERAKRKEAKIAAQKKLMADMGLTGEVKIEEEPEVPEDQIVVVADTVKMDAFGDPDYGDLDESLVAAMESPEEEEPVEKKVRRKREKKK